MAIYGHLRTIGVQLIATRPVFVWLRAVHGRLVPIDIQAKVRDQ